MASALLWRVLNKMKTEASRFPRLVKKPKQAPLFCQRLYAGKESLQAAIFLFAFNNEEPVLIFLPGLMPPGRRARSLLSCISYLEIGEPSLQDESFILPLRTEQVIPDRAARRDLIMRNHPSDDQGVTE